MIDQRHFLLLATFVAMAASLASGQEAARPVRPAGSNAQNPDGAAAAVVDRHVALRAINNRTAWRLRSHVLRMRRAALKRGGLLKT